MNGKILPMVMSSASVLFVAFHLLAMGGETGDLQITCNPGIQIYLDEEFAGVTKLEEDGLYLEGIEPGEHVVRAEKTGFMPQSFNIQIKAGRTMEVRIEEFVPEVKIKQEGEFVEGKIKAQVGKVVIKSVPLRCEVSFLNKDISKEKDWVTIEGIPVGSCPIVFRRGNETLRAELDIQSGVILEVKAHFRQHEVFVEKHYLREIIGRDGAPMVLIPAGEFQMGTDPAEIAQIIQWAEEHSLLVSADQFESETPRHTVYLDVFYIDKYEVTNMQYKKFVDATGHRAPKHWSDPEWNAPDQPVIEVDWSDAKAYCEWAGKRLPTEAEWEKAAHGGLVGKMYPWGDEEPNADGSFRTNYDSYYYTEDGYTNDGYDFTAPVGSFPPNGYGLYDMAGNVREWCNDWFDEGYYARSPKDNPKGPDSGEYRVLRGGAWYEKYICDLRVAKRNCDGPDLKNSKTILNGFRCIQDINP